MQKIGFVIPWFGENIPGGAEMELREVTAHLQKAGMEVEILTTCVKEFTADWNENYYAAGTAVVEDITVRRFPVRRRDTQAFDRVNRKLMDGKQISPKEEQIFVEEMVNSPQLYEYMRDAQDEYGLYVFIPYMFGTTYYGMQVCPEKSVLIPCFHDEAYVYMRLFRQAYVKARGMIYNAMPEMELANRVYDFTTTEQICMGIGMDTKIQSDADAFRKQFGIDKPFILYAGRKDVGKNVHTLLRYFAEWKHRKQDDLQLVLIGGGDIAIPESVKDDVYDLGFVSKQDKYNAMAAASLLCQPSHNESFSLVIMESWLCGRPGPGLFAVRRDQGFRQAFQRRTVLQGLFRVRGMRGVYPGASRGSRRTGRKRRRIRPGELRVGYYCRKVPDIFPEADGSVRR